MTDPPPSIYRVPFDGTFRIADAPTVPVVDSSKKEDKKDLERLVEELGGLQRRLYAQDRWAVLLVFQAMDAAGKDSTIRAVLTGVNPAGCQVSNFKQPSAEELDHDFLWRTTLRLPERGRIGVFNRSYYEEVLVVRVHPEFLASQKLPDVDGAGDLALLWERRYRSIREYERHLAANGTVILKFWLNVSFKEQRRRFVSRIDDPEKNWKFSAADVRERRYWKAYQAAYQDALNETSRPWAPWYAIPADDKPAMRRIVADIVVQALDALDLRFPAPNAAARAELEAARDAID